ncbi:MAG: cyclopropane-fatty-acyl-phospholipid synthase [Pseudorhodobacter sp. PARRP1]|nr:MAG: cyclopropane-fatty-acyl-phospholipid synthase [Pseudorhodobacter sp. PARRP1]
MISADPTQVDHIAGTTFHGRRGGVANRFSYGVDYVLLNPEHARGPWLFSRNRGNLTSVQDSDHGGPPKAGRGVAWVRQVLAEAGLPEATEILLLAQPRVLGHVFNPVSFWLCSDATGLRVVIAEVSNTFGQRHCYLCHRDDLVAMTRDDTVTARKIFHVSPFQPVEGSYQFRFDIAPNRIGIWIDYSAGENGLIATLTGPRVALSNRAILATFVRRPFGSRRVLTLIHWQALKLWWKGARYRSPPVPPGDEISR